MSLDISLVDVPCPRCGKSGYVFDWQITTNVEPMWRKAGVLDALYNAHDRRASSVVSALIAGIADIDKNLADYRRLNPANGWGDADGCLTFLKELLAACIMNPDARIRVHR